MNSNASTEMTALAAIQQSKIQMFNDPFAISRLACGTIVEQDEKDE
jgi:hypothetical protein